MSPVGLTLSYIGLWQAREKWVLGWSVKAPSPACSAWPTRSSIDWLYLVRSFLSEGRCCSLVALVSTRSSPSLPLSFSSTSCTALGGDLHHRKSSKRKKNDASELMGCHLYAYEKRAAFFSFLLESPISHFLNAEGTESHQHFGKHTTLMQLNHTHLKKKNTFYSTSPHWGSSSLPVMLWRFAYQLEYEWLNSTCFRTGELKTGKEGVDLL